MNHSFIDKYAENESPVHRLDPRTKLGLSLLLVVAVVLTRADAWWAYSAYLLTIVALFFVAGVPLTYVLKRTLIILPFVAMAGFFVPFIPGGETAVSLDIWWWSITVSGEGLEIFRNLMARAGISVLAMILLTSTTRFSELMAALDKLKAPRIVVLLMSFMYRYLFIITDEIMRMRQARDSRNFGGSRLWQAKTVGHMIGTLFIRSFERGERVYDAMTARGLNGNARIVYKHRFGWPDMITASVISALSVILVAAGAWL
ncbi:cobalt ECF transporter T component CbiQ [Chloroflexota bacterium]